jgi:hypothetical protein
METFLTTTLAMAPGLRPGIDWVCLTPHSSFCSSAIAGVTRMFTNSWIAFRNKRQQAMRAC